MLYAQLLLDQKTEGCRPAFGQTRDHIVQNKDSITIRFLIVNADKRPAPLSLLYVTFDLEGVERTAKNKNDPEDVFLKDGAICGGLRHRN